ncbi:hypothetical protein GL263_12500 [Streptomyces durbertensis]|uniref:Uncharacterized protein n=1 Tax=Streptomyces durbertensis TaxID=2448886 RepID=A0ABR6EGH7_9ACTN|nr:hypothetical protein [Streptomyces durbertensis]MBB1244373.1 hypothetical protein [Streptomyces durbertensis]
METTSRATAPAGVTDRSAPRPGEHGESGELAELAGTAGFPWYGLDEAFGGRRWLMQVGAGSDGTVEHGALGHGDQPSLRSESEQMSRRFAVVVTVAARPLRRSADGTGVLEATSGSSAAWLAGSGLLSCTWPVQMERSLRQDWLEQQTDIAWDLADNLGGDGWSTLSLPVDGVPVDFHYRESEYGWVLAGSAESYVHLGAYGRGMSAYGLGFGQVPDLAAYTD